MNIKHFSDISIGYASAEIESQNTPEALISGFYDPLNRIGKLIESEKFIVLGRKGAGKSAIGKHLELASEKDAESFVQHLFLADLSYRDLASIVRGGEEDRLAFPKAWSWLLLLLMIGSISRDEGFASEQITEHLRTIESLKEAGLLAPDSIDKAIQRSSDRGLSIAGVKIWEKKSDDDSTITAPAFSDHIKDLLARGRTQSRHIIVLDGLDDVLLSSEEQFTALSALLFESARLNEFFKKKSSFCKIIVLCRTDIFERLPGPNLNKLRQDLSIELSWPVARHDPSLCGLVQMINKKVKSKEPEIEDIFSEFFPPTINTKDCRLWLINHTRNTPRDLIALLRSIQEHCSRTDMLRGSFQNGLRSYSESYFMPEIKDELFGGASRIEIDMVFDLIMELRNAEFTIQALKRQAKLRNGALTSDQIDKLLNLLYDCGAVGSYYPAPSLRGNQPSKNFQFKYRNPASKLVMSDIIVIHPGLRRALNLW